MTTPIEAAKRLIARCNLLRNQGRVEDVLREEFTSHLRVVFPKAEDAAWVNHVTEGREAGTRVRDRGDGTSYRFIDTLVRSTVIEYEHDLRQQAVWDTGYNQVRMYVAGTYRSGTPISQIRGVLSDTVEWHVFDAAVAEGVLPERCRPEDVVLTEVEVLKAEKADAATAAKLIDFLRKHLAREQSRTVNASFITTDLGLESTVYAGQEDALTKLVDQARGNDASVRLATNLWSAFVDSLESHNRTFRTAAYVDEAYITILARLLCANILAERARLSTDAELRGILTGRYFESEFHLRNMVEQDYFGWLLRGSYLDGVLPIAREVQRDLYAYDFAHIAEEDLFGRLMAQLSRRSERKLLGQEWTPQWVARSLTEKCLDKIPEGEPPRVVDMCCGSGSMLAEVLKATKARYGRISFEQLSSAATGFDIDPLAVLLAKTTWVVTLAGEIRKAREQVIIPVYHADSLFAVTPISREIPLPGEAAGVLVELDGEGVCLPAELIQPAYREVFDDVVDWAYDEAIDAQRKGRADQVTAGRAKALVEALVAKHKVACEPELQERICEGVFNLTHRMAVLAVENRNGIWAFILRNTYRPGLLAGQFNGLVSNPPWLALSQFAENPYKTQLSARAEIYGIKPGGAAHLHLELATTHLLHAIDRYLKAGAAFACLVPGTVLKGQHHAKFRDAAYLEADRPVAFELQEVWDIAEHTFKLPAIAVIGVKRRSIAKVARRDPQGAVASAEGLAATTFDVRRLRSGRGERTAWVLGGVGGGVEAPDEVDLPKQGADIMPRVAVCVEIVKREGTEWPVRTPERGDPGFFALMIAKQLRDATFPGRVARPFLYRMVQSLNLLPFVLDGNFVNIAIPAVRRRGGEWEVLNSAAIRTAGFRDTARRFEQIDQALEAAGVVKPLREKIDERHKLTAQVFPRGQFLVLYGAGGGISCAAWVPVDEVKDVVVDQTLYWGLVTSEDEAWYRTGLMNSEVLTEAVREFNPSGDFGERHLHTLPSRVIPQFARGDRKHVEVARAARALSGQALQILREDENIADPKRALSARRRSMRAKLKGTDEWERLEEACAAVLGIKR